MNERKSMVAVILAIAETLREVKESPSGPLYAAMMAHGVSFEAYTTAIATLKGAKLIEEKYHVLRWVGPTF